VELAPEWPKKLKLKINTKTLQIIPITPEGGISTTHIGASFSIRNLVHWKTVLSTAVLRWSRSNLKSRIDKHGSVLKFFMWLHCGSESRRSWVPN